MIRGGPVSFEHEWERHEGDPEVLIQVSATINDYHPAVYYLANGDPGYPEEGGDVENLKVWLPDGTELYPIPEDLYKVLVEQAVEKYRESREEQL